MKKKMTMVLLMVLIAGISCKSPSGPSDPTPTYKTEDIIEFMYVRTLPIISPNNPGPSGMTIWHDNYGVLNPDGWSSIGPDQWTCSKSLKYNQFPYFIFLVDMKTSIEYKYLARTIFARIRGQGDWIELTSIGANGITNGEWAKFLLYHDVLNPNPSSSSFSR